MKKRVICIPDLHGKNDWKSINIDEYQKIIFIGDYVDSWTATNDEIYNNLLEIIQLKKDYPDKVVLLLGNHCCSYMWFPEFRCSGFRPEAQSDLSRLFRDNKDLFQVAYQIDNYLFTHAGVSNKWFNKHIDIINYYRDTFETKNLADIFNLIANSKDYSILVEVGKARGGSRFNVGSLTWADQSETINDMLDGYHSICGHTPVKNISTYYKSKDENTSITYIDVLDLLPNTFYELEI